jgi:hypothetical protein
MSIASRLAASVAVMAATLSPLSAAAQGAPPGAEVIGTPLVSWLASRPHAPPNTLPNFATDAARAKEFRELVRALIEQDWQAATGHAKAAGYRIVFVREADSWFAIASDEGSAGRDPTVVVNLRPRREVILEAPHVPFEKGTVEEAAVLLRELGGRAAIISGAHRCASRAFTPCDGRTQVCGTMQGYRDSDVSHNVDTLFHVAHVMMSERWRSATVVSLHGMKEDDDGVRTSLIVSNGARAADQAQQTTATKLRLALGSSIKQPGAVVSCNLPADAVYEFRKLCGYTNVQARHVNGGADACRASVEQGTGRFVHLEQDQKVLRPFEQDWARIGQHPFGAALIAAFTAVLPPVKD